MPLYDEELQASSSPISDKLQALSLVIIELNQAKKLYEKTNEVS